MSELKMTFGNIVPQHYSHIVGFAWTTHVSGFTTKVIASVKFDFYYCGHLFRRGHFEKKIKLGETK